jgi:hypothetical protein
MSVEPTLDSELRELDGIIDEPMIDASVESSYVDADDEWNELDSFV